MEMGGGIQLTHHFESVIDTPDEAEQYGMDCAYIMQAYNEGYGRAKLGESDG